MSLELKKAIEQISKDRGLDRDMLVSTLEEAVRTSVIRKYGDDLDVEVHYSDDTGDIEVFQFKFVVEEVENPLTQISLEDAREHDPSIQLDDEMGFRLKVEDLGRIAAQSAKQVIIQGIREAERGVVYESYSSKAQELLTATVLRADPNGNIFVRIGAGNDASDAVLRASEQIPGETYDVGDRIKVYVSEVKSGESRGPLVTLSRINPNFIKRLFELEIPEIQDGTIVVKDIAREAGSRSKVAVYSTDPNVDAVGSCIGKNGMRIAAILGELAGEKIDIIKYSDNKADYVAEALSPAKVLDVIMEDEKTCRITVSPDQLSLAIGKEGQNAKLVAKLTGCKIDIKA